MSSAGSALTSCGSGLRLPEKSRACIAASSDLAAPQFLWRWLAPGRIDNLGNAQESRGEAKPGSFLVREPLDHKGV